MSDPAIEVHGLGKQYRIGESQAGYRTLRDTLVDGLRAPFRRMSKMVRGEAYAGTELHSSIWALKDIFLCVEQGEVLGIIGRNGAGKTTLLKILSRITEPSEGYADIRGRVGSLLEVGVGFHPELTGRENVYLNGAILGMKKGEIESKYGDIVEFAEVEKFIDTPMKHYSSGMQVRLAFAIAAHLEPEILLVDEVLAVGDIEFQKKCMGRMGSISREGRTVLFVSHNLTAIKDLCPRTILLDEGCIVKEGPSFEVVQEYVLGIQSQMAEAELRDESLRRIGWGWSEKSLFRWHYIAVIDSSGSRNSNIRFGESFEIIVKGEAFADIEDLRAGIGIETVDGSKILNSYQTDGGLSSAVRKGPVGMRCSIDPNILSPGLYEISLGARGTGVSEWIPNALVLNILPVSMDDEEAAKPDVFGLVWLPFRWEWES